MAHAHNRTLLAKLGFADADRSVPEHDLACRFLAQPEQMQRIAQMLRVVPGPPEGLHNDAAQSPETAWQKRAALLGLAGIYVPDFNFEKQKVFAGGAWRFEFSSNGETRSLLHENGKVTLGPPKPALAPPGAAGGAPLRGGGERPARQYASIEQAFEAKEGALLREVLDLPIGGMKEVKVTGDYALGAPELEKPLNKGTGAYKTTVGFADLVFSAFDQWRWDMQQGAFGGHEISASAVRLSSAPTLDVCVEVKATRETAATLLRQMKLYAEYLPEGTRLVAATAFALPPSDVAMLKSQGVTTIRLAKGFEEYVAQLKQLPLGDEKPEEF